jgi:hypothetical protein
MRNASFCFHSEKWHKKKPEAAWLPGLRCLHLLRQHNMGSVVNLDASAKTRKLSVFKGVGGF